MSAASEKGVRVAFEASVGGGIPVLKALNESLCSQQDTVDLRDNQRYSSTTSSQGWPLRDVNLRRFWREAQRLGYAERDPHI